MIPRICNSCKNTQNLYIVSGAFGEALACRNHVMATAQHVSAKSHPSAMSMDGVGDVWIRPTVQLKTQTTLESISHDDEGYCERCGDGGTITTTGLCPMCHEETTQQAEKVNQTATTTDARMKIPSHESGGTRTMPTIADLTAKILLMARDTDRYVTDSNTDAAHGALAIITVLAKTIGQVDQKKSQP